MDKFAKKSLVTNALRIAGALAVLAAAGAELQPAVAATVTANMAVSATVVKACNISTTGLSFGNYTFTAANLTATATVTVHCNKNTSSVISLGLGNNAGKGAFGSRAMTDGAGNYLGYEIYQDAANATVWNTVNTETVANSSPAVNLTAYGTIGTGQDLPTGNYTDTVVVTATF